jgi:hypothetical protein
MPRQINRLGGQSRSKGSPASAPGEAHSVPPLEEVEDFYQTIDRSPVLWRLPFNGLRHRMIH